MIAVLFKLHDPHDVDRKGGVDPPGQRALVVGVERNGERILNPESTFKFESGDIAWVVGDEDQIEAFLTK